MREDIAAFLLRGLRGVLTSVPEPPEPPEPFGLDEFVPWAPVSFENRADEY